MAKKANTSDVGSGKLMASPLISLAISHGSPELKDKDKEKAKHARLDANKQVSDSPLSSVARPTWKPPTHKERIKMAAEDSHVASTRRWVAGEISTKEHKENMKRAKEVLGFKN